MSVSSVKVNPVLLKENNKEQLDKYQCPRCRHILKDAVQTSCGHWLCNDCADDMFKKNPRPNCPRDDCGEELVKEDGRSFFPDRFVRKEISRFQMVCLNSKFGCDWTGTVGKLEEHLLNCQYDNKECPHCKELFISTEIDKHIAICPKAIVACPLKDYGCDHRDEMTRKDCLSHVSSSSGIYEHLMLIVQYLATLAPVSSSHKQEVESDGPNQFRGGPPQERIQLDGGGHGSKIQMVESGYQYNGTVGGAAFDIDSALNSLAMLPNSQKSAQIFTIFKQQLDVIQTQLSKKDSMIHQLQERVQQLETTVMTKNVENEDRDFRLSLMENSNYDGTMVWKIPQFSQRREDARTGKYTSIFSLPFYSGRYGYKMCLRLYILGDGIGKGTHMSLFFVVMRGEFDNILQWPFTHKVTFKLINQCGGRDIVDIFQPDPLSSSFQKPKSDMNVASGCPRFVSSNELMQGGFIVDDTIFIKVKVDTTTMRHP